MTATASDLAAGPASSATPAPAAGGLPPLPASAQAARETIAARISDKEFGKRLLSNDQDVKQAARAEWDALHKTAYPAPLQITSINDVNDQAAGRAAEHWNSYIGSLKQKFPLTAEQEAEIRGGQVIAAVFEWAKDQKAQMLADREFRTKVLQGNRAANKEGGLITQILSLRPVPGFKPPGRK
jgi:hypothetical protein